jgi:hypothetical protein
MWVMLEVLAPGVEHSQHTDARTEVAWIGRYLQQGLRSCPEQLAIKQTLVPECERRQLLGYSKDDMGVGHRQQA